MTQCSLEAYGCHITLIVNPILTNFKKSEISFHPLPNSNYHQGHHHCLITILNSNYVEIGVVTDICSLVSLISMI